MSASRASDRQLMSGNEAVARGAWEAGCTVSTAYPGTPATEINEFAAGYPEIDAEWSVNEKVALEVAIGASLAGARAMASMKQVGVNVAADALFSLAYTGVNGGLVIVTADEPGLHSSQNEQDNRFYAKFAQVPMLEPADSQEAKDLVLAAFELSERYDTPVFLRMTTRVCHSTGVVRVSPRHDVPRRPYVKNADKNAMVPSHAYQRHFALERRQTLLEAESEVFAGNRIEMRSLQFGAVTSGISYQNVREALPEFSTLKITMTYPLPHQMIRNFASQVQKLYVIEENRPFLEEEILATGIPVEGKQQLLRVGELPASALRRRILHKDSGQKPPVEGLPKRAPQFCPGCLHRGIFYLLGKLKYTVTGDIGCYGLAALPPYNAMDSLVCMGAGLTMAHGFDKVVRRSTTEDTEYTEENKNNKILVPVTETATKPLSSAPSASSAVKAPVERVVGVVGDSTFFHSGLTGVANAVFNRGVSTFLILDNRVTAMTGHQPDPASGWGIDRKPAPRIDIEEACRALGVKRVFRAGAFDLEGLQKLLQAETAVPEPSVIIVEGPCVFMDRGPRRAACSVDEEKCANCRLCFRLGCPALTVEAGKVRVLADMCRGCGLCVQVCPKAAISQAEARP
jgi:indolepyruvate ferredoxin oxidoreductase alpha subunit